MPAEIVFYTTDGSCTSIKISEITRTKAYPDSYFRFDPKGYRGVEVIDLR